MGRTGWLLALVVTGCAEEVVGTPTPGPARPAFAVFPDQVGSDELLPRDLPHADTLVPVERLAWRDGLSTVQTTVIRPGVALDASSLPGLDGDGLTGSVRMVDLTDGTPVRCMAELDAWPGANPPVLLVRPLTPMPVGHEIAVAVTRGVRTTDGAAWSGPDWFAAIAQGAPHPDLEGRVEPTKALLAALETAGVEDVVLATRFVVGDGTRPLRSMLDGLPTPSAHSLTVTEDDLPDGVWRKATGSFTTSNWLVDDTQFELVDGRPVAKGTVDAELYVHIPASVKDAEDGSAPVWIFGHGIFSHPSRYLDDDKDPSGVIDLAERAGAILVGTTWRGLTTADIDVPFTVGADFGRFPVLTDHLAQGVANTSALIRLVTEGDLLDDPAFAGKADPDTIRWYGISLGSIEGSVTVALNPAVPRAVFHVGGSTWSTMLERSQHWSLFESTLVDSGLSDPADRQLLYAVSQLFWDPVDPASYAAELSSREVLYQVAVGDDQVPNFTLYTLARGVGAGLLEPAVVDVPGLDGVDASATGPVVTQFDPEEGSSDATNRPAEDTTAHDVPRLWEGTKRQVLGFLDADAPALVAPCGDAPCTLDHQE